MSKTEAFLLGLKTRGGRYTLDRMQEWDRLLKAPHSNYPVIHIAGTNGKGSTAAMLEAIYRRSGYKTGLYTSPHLLSLRERIQINREPITTEQLETFTKKLTDSAQIFGELGSPHFPSYFEFMTMMAFYCFNALDVDVAIIETGLGGRLDATNIVNPEISLITSIGLDHTEVLGETIEAIAREKAGIIKTNKPVALGKVEDNAREVIQTIAKAKDAPFHEVNEDSETPETNLEGSFQRDNAALALLACNAISKKLPISTDIAKAALREVQWPLRWDIRTLEKNFTLILDSTHNTGALPGLIQNIRALKKPPTIAMGFSSEARAKDLIPALSKETNHIIFLDAENTQCLSSDILVEYLPPSFGGQVSRMQTVDLINSCKAELGLLLVTGSIYAASEVFATLSGVNPVVSSQYQDASNMLSNI